MVVSLTKRAGTQTSPECVSPVDTQASRIILGVEKQFHVAENDVMFLDISIRFDFVAFIAVSTVAPPQSTDL